MPKILTRNSHQTRRHFPELLSLMFILTLSACANTPESAQRIGGVQEVVPGTVTGVQPVQTPAGSAEQITIRLESGRMIAVTQAVTQSASQLFHAGDKVNVLSGNGITSVTH